MHTQAVPDNNNNMGKTQTCTGDDLKCDVIASTAAERYTERKKKRASVRREKKTGGRMGGLWHPESKTNRD